MSKGSWKRMADVPRESKRDEVVIEAEVQTTDSIVSVPYQNSDIITWVSGVPMCARCERSPEILEDGTVKRYQEMRAMPDVWMCPRCESWEKR